MTFPLVEAVIVCGLIATSIATFVCLKRRLEQSHGSPEEHDEERPKTVSVSMRPAHENTRRPCSINAEFVWEQVTEFLFGTSVRYQPHYQRQQYYADDGDDELPPLVSYRGCLTCCCCLLVLLSVLSIFMARIPNRYQKEHDTSTIFLLMTVFNPLPWFGFTMAILVCLSLDKIAVAI